MRRCRKLKIGFTAYSAITLVLLFFLLEKNAFHKSKSMDIGMLNDIHRNIFKEFEVTYHINKAETSKYYPCADVSVPNLGDITDKWQPVDDDTNAFVYSAYFVHESKKVVILSLRKQVTATIYFCQFWYRNGNQFALSYQKHAKIVGLPLTHGLPYAAEMFECQMHKYDSPPSHVSIVDINCTVPRNLLSVQHGTKPEQVRRNFTICLPPLFGKPNIYRFVEWLEFNIMLGAEKIFIYNYTSNVQIHKLLEFYINRGFINIINWTLPEIKTEANISKPISVHYHGQIVALNDCLYRNKYQSEYIVNVDMDEFIIPRMENETTWHQMITHFDLNQNVYIIRNMFFRKEWDNANIEILNKTLVEKYDLITLQKLQHEKKIFPAERRSKYFAKTLRVSSLMIHTLNMSDFKFAVPVNIALMHHYRDIKLSSNLLLNTKVTDRTVPTKYGDALIKKVVSVWSKLNRTLSDIMQED